MTYLIQSKSARAYFHSGQWMTEPERAELFPDAARAIAVCLEHELRDAELVLQFASEGGRTHHLHLSLPEQMPWRDY